MSSTVQVGTTTIFIYFMKFIKSLKTNLINKMHLKIDFTNSYSAAHGGEMWSCQRYEKGESGRIETPNFPASYRAGANCRWVLEGPINSKIQVNSGKMLKPEILLYNYSTIVVTVLL
jgi:hypothetical protein